MSSKPFIKTALLFALSAVAGSPLHAQQSGLQERLGALLGKPAQDQLLEPDQAFRLNVSVQGRERLLAQVSPAPGYYLYRDKLRFRLQDGSGVAIRKVTTPPGETKDDPTFGKTEVYKSPITVELALAGSGARTVTLLASYQGCHEKLGVCYPPIEKAVKLSLP